MALAEPASRGRPYNQRMPTAHPQSLRRLLLRHDLVFLALVVIMGVLAGTWAILWQQSSAESIRVNHLGHIGQEIRSLVFKQIQEVSVAALREDPRARELNSDYVKRVQEHFNQLRRSSANRAEDYAVQAMQTAFSLLQASLRKTLEDPSALNRLVRAKIFDPAFEQVFVADFEHAFVSFTGLLTQQLAAQEQAIRRRNQVAPYALVLPILLGIALLVFSRRGLTAGFVQPMRSITEGTREISAGNLAHLLPETGVAEARELARSINGMARQLERSRAAILEAERQSALGALVPVVAHNIRNPLAAIRANAQLLDDSDTVAERREIRQAVIETVDRLGRWVTALVSYLHPLNPQLRPVRATELFEAALMLLAPRLTQLGVGCERLHWDEEAYIEADRDLMEQALYGLLLNAAEASSAGSIVTIAIERDGEQIRMQIGDSAGGIPFKPEPSGLTPGPTTKRFGTGLGIPVAFKICNTLGYTLAFVVDPGRGTNVVITADAALRPRE